MRPDGSRTVPSTEKAERCCFSRKPVTSTLWNKTRTLRVVRKAHLQQSKQARTAAVCTAETCLSDPSRLQHLPPALVPEVRLNRALPALLLRQRRPPRYAQLLRLSKRYLRRFSIPENLQDKKKNRVRGV